MYAVPYRRCRTATANRQLNTPYRRRTHLQRGAADRQLFVRGQARHADHQPRPDAVRVTLTVKGLVVVLGGWGGMRTAWLGFRLVNMPRGEPAWLTRDKQVEQYKVDDIRLLAACFLSGHGMGVHSTPPEHHKFTWGHVPVGFPQLPDRGPCA